MVCQKVKIKNPAGLHLRPAGKLCDEAIKYYRSSAQRYGPDQIQIKDFFSERNNDYKCKEPFECAGGRH